MRRDADHRPASQQPHNSRHSHGPAAPASPQIHVKERSKVEAAKRSCVPGFRHHDKVNWIAPAMPT